MSGCIKLVTMSFYILRKLAVFGNIHTVEDVKYDVLQGFIASIRDTLKPLTVNKHIARIRRFLEFCVNMEYITINHANKLETYKCKTPIRYSFSKDEIQMILRNI